MEVAILKLFLGFVLAVHVHETNAVENNGDYKTMVTFSPEILETLTEGETTTVVFNYTCCPPVSSRITAKVSDQAIAFISAAEESPLPAAISERQQNSNITFTTSVNITAKRLGEATLLIYSHPQNECLDTNKISAVSKDYRIVVERRKTIHRKIFQIALMVFMSVMYLGFGCEIDMHVIWTYIKNPVQLAIGMLCQFILLPLVSTLYLFIYFLINFVFINCFIEIALLL